MKNHLDINVRLKNKTRVEEIFEEVT